MVDHTREKCPCVPCRESILESRRLIECPAHASYRTRKNAGFRGGISVGRSSWTFPCVPAPPPTSLSPPIPPPLRGISSSLDRCLVGFQSVHDACERGSGENKPSCSSATHFQLRSLFFFLSFFSFFFLLRELTTGGIKNNEDTCENWYSYDYL